MPTVGLEYRGAINQHGFCPLDAYGPKKTKQIVNINTKINVYICKLSLNVEKKENRWLGEYKMGCDGLIQEGSGKSLMV